MLNDLAQSSGKAFTLSACDSGVGESSHFLKCCDANTFLDTDCGNKYVWLCLPKDNIKDYLQHYFQCKADVPHTTSACIILPNWKHAGNPWRKYLRKMILLRDFPRSALPCLTGQETGRVRTWQVHYDAPVPQPSISALCTDAAPVLRSSQKSPLPRWSILDRQPALLASALQSDYD